MIEKTCRALLAVAALTTPAVAQVGPAPDSPASGGGAWKTDLRASAALGLLDETGGGKGTSGTPLLDLSAVIRREDVYASGLRLLWRAELRAQRDAPGRTAFGGVVGACAGGQAGCPAAEGGTLSPVAPATGLAVGGADGEDELFLAVEGASISLAGGWGEGIVGLDSGAAARLDARPPRVLEAAGVVSPGLDPTGRSVVRARNDVTGPSAKASYLSPRWLGLRLGASFTPDANLRGADFDAGRSGSGLATADLEQVWEGAISFDRRMRSSGLRVRAALTGVTAEQGSVAGAGEPARYESIGGGLELEREGWTGGLRWLSSNNGQESGGRYSAFEAGLTHAAGPWRFGLEAGWSQDDLLNMEGRSYLAGASRAIGEHLRLGIAWTESRVDVPSAGGGREVRQGRGIVFEATVRN